MFDIKGSCIFPTKSREPDSAVLGVLNSSSVTKLLAFTSPTLDFSTGAIESVPVPFLTDTQTDELRQLVDSAISYAKTDWDRSEMSWDYREHELAEFSKGNLDQFCKTVVKRRLAHIANVDETQGQIDSTVATLFGIENENLHPHESSDLSQETLPPDTMREFISYAVGCMLGRYSLDKPGLILANQGETADDYRKLVSEPTFVPDEDNVIPLLDGDWFTDDISERFKEFLKVTFGTEHYEENLTFLENALYPDNLTGKKRKTIRDYFLKEFYKHHIKLYKKRPIYWLFSSKPGTGAAFSALIYMHRYRPDTVSVVLNDYLREFMTKLRSKIEALQQLADSGDAAKTEKTKALKEITKLNKQLKELEDYDRDVLFPLATKQVEIDLDDGVKHNYNLFGTALKKVTGLTGKG